MSPPVSATEAGRSAGRLAEREKWDWTAVVARYTRDDWPPPAWLARATMAEGGIAPAMRRVPKVRTSVAA